MEILKLSAPLIFSRLGDMIGSLIFFSFIGHYIVDSLSAASFAIASLSFLTVVGIGFFSSTLITVAGATNLNTDKIKSEIAVSFNLAISLGLIILCIIFLAGKITSELETTPINPDDLKALLILAISMPAVYLQITIFNFYNGIRKTQYELTFTWLLNTALASICIVCMNIGTDINLSDFIITYVCLRYLFSFAALAFFRMTIQRHLNSFSVRKKLSKDDYIKYTICGLPMALCFGSESLLFLLLSLISKHINDISLSAYQASIHAASIIYMISIGIGNAAGLMTARHYATKDFEAISKTHSQAILLGLFALAPILAASFLLNEYISLIYTSDTATRSLIEKNIIISIPFLIFEFIFVVTRLTLRGMNDLWTPTIMTILTLNVFGVFSSAILLSLYEYTVHSIFLALVACSFILMLLLSWRLRHTLHHAKTNAKENLCRSKLL
ncbi:MATE family efflux transporter [Pseudomonas fluorescens]|uniref:MATE family efflux transporter n=1 Tax=Pseudomonas fluorescens TaxID=294 RepID=UPI0009B8512E|nr:MATE family efflux transporter [Pseudomonas fluorescens]